MVRSSTQSGPALWSAQAHMLSVRGQQLVKQGSIPRSLRGKVAQVSPPFTTTDDEVRGIVAATLPALDSMTAEAADQELAVAR